jgi:hypothetical protein
MSELPPPTVLRPFRDNELQYRTSWQPYPESGYEVPIYPHAINDARFRFYEITAKLIPVSVSGPPQDSPLPGHIILDQAEIKLRLDEIEDDLMRWERSFPLGTRPEDLSIPNAPLVDLQ